MKERIEQAVEECRKLGAYNEFNDNETRVFFYKQYLNETDYAIIKIYEAAVQGGNILNLLAEYKEIFNNRKEAREMINKLESLE